MIRRVSLVRKRPELTREEFLAALDRRARRDRADGCPGLRGYVIQILDGDESAVSTGSRSRPSTRARRPSARSPTRSSPTGLRRTRDEFAASVEVYFAEEHIIVEEDT